MGATPRGDLPRNEGRRNYPYGPHIGKYGQGTASPHLLSIHFRAIKTPEDVEARRPLFEAIQQAQQTTMANQYGGGRAASSKDRSLPGKARVRARKAANR